MATREPGGQSQSGRSRRDEEIDEAPAPDGGVGTLASGSRWKSTAVAHGARTARGVIARRISTCAPRPVRRAPAEQGASVRSAAHPARNMWTAITCSVTYVAFSASTALGPWPVQGQRRQLEQGDQLPERKHVAAGLDPSGRLPALFTTPGISSFSEFLSMAAPDLLPGRRPLPPGMSVDIAP